MRTRREQRTQRRRGAVCCVLLGCLAVTAVGCTSQGDAPASSNVDRQAPDGSTLQPVSLPDLSKLTASVQAQVRERHAALTAKLADRGASATELAASYGEMGRLLMAAQSDAAEPYFLNAEALDRADRRWPYYRAHLLRRKGDLSGAAALFERVVALDSTDVAARFWLGDLYLAQGRPEAAEPHF